MTSNLDSQHGHIVAPFAGAWIEMTGEQSTSRNVKAATAALSEDFTYDVIKEKPKVNTVTFIKTDDFDSNPEPVIVSKVTVMLDKKGNVKEVVQGEKSNTKIIPDKSEYVSDNYTGFNVTEQKAREQSWKNSGIQYNSSKLDNPDYFYETFSSAIQRSETTQNVTENKFTSDAAKGYHDSEVITQPQEENENDRGRKKERPSSSETISKRTQRSGEKGRGIPSYAMGERRGENEDELLRYERESNQTRDLIRERARSGKNNREIIVENYIKKNGAEVMFYDSNGENLPLGMHDSINGCIYINADNTDIEQTAGHELFHYLVRTTTEFQDVLKTFLYIPFESDKKKIFNHVDKYIAKVCDNDKGEIARFKQHPEKGLERSIS